MHCKSGADRAGLASALYLLAHRRARSRRRGGSSRGGSCTCAHSRTGILDHVLDLYAARLAAGPDRHRGLGARRVRPGGRPERGWRWRRERPARRGRPRPLALARLARAAPGRVLARPRADGGRGRARSGSSPPSIQPMFDRVFTERRRRLAGGPRCCSASSSLRAAASAGQKIVLARAAERTAARLRGDLLAHLMALDGPFHRDHPPGLLLERVQGDVQAVGGVWTAILTGRRARPRVGGGAPRRGAAGRLALDAGGAGRPAAPRAALGHRAALRAPPRGRRAGRRRAHGGAARRGVPRARGDPPQRARGATSRGRFREAAAAAGPRRGAGRGGARGDPRASWT